MALATEREKIAHLLRRAGLGASPAELAEYEPLGLTGAVDALLDFKRRPPGLGLSVWVAKDPRYGELFPYSVAIWWSLALLMSQRPLEQKLTLFWHDHFGLSGAKVEHGRTLYQHLELLRRNCLGRFETLLKRVTRDPAMLIFLDGQYNKKGHPNENYAREVMELYTLGIGHYSERDIQEAARAFSGFSLMPGLLSVFVRRPIGMNASFEQKSHDSGEKEILGRRGNFGANEAIEVLVQQPQTARYITRKLWEYFAYPEPEESVLERLCAVWQSSGGNIRAVLRSLLTSPEFYSARAERALYKSPVDFVMGSLRALGVPRVVDWLSGAFRAGWRKPLADVGGFLLISMQGMGQLLLHPPSVAGWDGGASWLSSGSMTERIKFAEIFNPASDSPLGGLLARRMQAPTAEDFARQLDRQLDAGLPPEKLSLIAGAIESDFRAAGGPDARSLYQALRLFFAAPEYQML